jgi:hypothetical protein
MDASNAGWAASPYPPSYPAGGKQAEPSKIAVLYIKSLEIKFSRRLLLTENLELLVEGGELSMFFSY